MRKKEAIILTSLLVLSAGCLTSCEVIGVDFSIASKSVKKISTKEDFYKIEKNTKNTYVLENDIDFGGDPVNLNIGFKGTLDGNGHKLSNIRNVFFRESYKLFKGHYNWASIFREIEDTGVIKNVIFDHCNVDIKYEHGYDAKTDIALVAGDNNGTIENCVFNSCSLANKADQSIALTDYDTALICGTNSIKGKISNNTLIDTKVTIDGEMEVAGDEEKTLNTGTICGTNLGIVEKNLLSTSIIRAYTVGGLVFKNLGTISKNANIDQRIYSPYTTKLGFNHKYVGGLVAYNSGEINDSYCFDSNIKIENDYLYSGTFHTNSLVGGLIGLNDVTGNMNRCYFKGMIRAEERTQDPRGTYDNKDAFIGGICGKNAVDLYHNFSDCAIEAPFSNISLTCGYQYGQAFRDINSCSIAEANSTHRLSGKNQSKYGTETYLNTVDSDTLEVLYYLSSTQKETKSWTDFLKYKGILVDDNYEIETFYPTIKETIGSALVEDNTYSQYNVSIAEIDSENIA